MPTEKGAICAACHVINGECPNCGTYYFTRDDGKRFGIRPSDAPSYKPGVYTRYGTTFPSSLDQIANAFRCST
jgi:hypothetical protein